MMALMLQNCAEKRTNNLVFDLILALSNKQICILILIEKKSATIR